MSSSCSRLLTVRAALRRMWRALRLYVANRSLRAWFQAARFLALRMVGRPAPAFLDIALTYRCQCRCPHCAAASDGNAQDGELDTDQLRSVIRQAARLGVLEVIFSGGEPLLRGDLEQLVREAHQAGMLTRVNTNGLLLDRERAARLKRARLTQCCVSLDAADAEVHDRLRGVPGLFDKALGALGNLRAAGIPFQLHTYARKESLQGDLERIAALGRELGAIAVFIFFPVAAGRWHGAFEQALSSRERAGVRALLRLPGVDVELPGPRSLCGVSARWILALTPSGDVTPCPPVPYVIGNVKEHGLQELWRTHCATMRLRFRGRCPMNDVRWREALRRHVESVAARLSSPVRGR